MEENIIKCVTRGNSSPNGKPRIYFTCHPDDFEKYFQKVCDDIFSSHDAAIYYTPDMTTEFDEINKEADLGRINLFVIPVTYNLLTTKNRALNHDLPYALKNHIPVLPLMMETGIDTLYSERDKFGELQYLYPFSTNYTEISYNEKLKKFLNAVLISDELAQRVRKAFDSYIFLSYRKKDRAYANRLIKLIHSNPEYRDIAIWFDEFLSPGESFKENIEKILKDSKLFTLLVTPNLLEEPDGKPNFVMEKEYPAALASGMKILPTEMEETNKDELSKKFKDLPPCVNPDADFEALRNYLAETLTKAAKENNNDPEHNFLIGLAYLEGIDVEIDKKRGYDLIASAALKNLPEAMIKLRDSYLERIDSGNDYRDAPFWAEQTYKYYHDTYGETHPETLASLNVYANICTGAKRPRKAFELAEKAHELCIKALGENHEETLSSLNALAMASEKVLDFENSLALFKKAYTLCTETLGEVHPVTLTAVNNFATFYFNRGKFKDSLALFEKAYNLRCTYLGQEHPDTLRSLDSLADTYTKLKKHKKAVEFREKEYNLYRTILGNLHPDTLTKLHELGLFYGKAGKNRKCVELLEKAYNLRSSAFGEEDHDASISLLNLSQAYLKLGKLATAQKALVKHSIYRKPYSDIISNLPAVFNDSTFEEDDRAKLKSLFLQAEEHEAHGEKNNVISTYKKMYDMACNIFGEAHTFPQNIMSLLIILCFKYCKLIKAYKYYFVLYKITFKMMISLSKDLAKDIAKLSKK